MTRQVAPGTRVARGRRAGTVTGWLRLRDGLLYLIQWEIGQPSQMHRRSEFRVPKKS